jgi:sterol desaturase/sphingolipid hydroxylase (fatty acid hydroxylase superfamily)
MSLQEVIIITLIILFSGNLFGVVYSLIVLKTSVFAKYRIQTKPYKKGVFMERLPLYLLNLGLLTVFAVFGVYSLYDFFDTELPSIWVFLGQLLFVTFIDDVWFYFAHRYMHQNKYLLKKVHSIHHRAHTPFPLEYLYVHPFEWMLGIIGTFAGYLLILLVMPLNIYAFWAFALLRNLHEIHIHSDLNLPFLKNVPLISPVEDHDVHHAKLNGNYASTFRIWDRIMNTRFKE